MKPLGLDDAALKTEWWLHVQIQKALVELLETKQLYQNVAIDLAPVEAQIISASKSRRMASTIPTVGGSGISQADFEQLTQRPYRLALSHFNASEWLFDTEYYQLRTQGHNQGAGPVYFRTPTIKVTCPFCDAVVPAHNSGYPGLKDKVPSVPLGISKHGFMQALAFPFFCQSCKQQPVVYLVTRRGNRLTLTGKSEFPEISVPKFIPVEEKDHFSKSLISHAAGHTLAGILYLRVFVEQYMRRITDAKGKMTGDGLGELYRLYLHDDFPKGFKSLAKIYEELSEKLHAAEASVAQFELSKKEIEQHLKQLELLPLKTTSK